MGQDTQQLREEIALRREDLGYTVDAIEDRVSPSRIMQRRKSALRQSISGFSDKIMGNMEYAKGAATHAASDVKENLADMRQNAQGKASSMNESAHDMGDMAMNRAQGSPLLAGAVAAGIGFLASVAFPSTKAETQAVQQLSDKAQPLMDEAKQAGSEMASAIKENMKEKGMESANELKQQAAGHAEEVKSSAQETVQQTKSQVQDKAQDLKGQVQDTAQETKS